MTSTVRYRPLSRRLDRCNRMIQNESMDPFGGRPNVYYVTMQITLLTRNFRNVERNLHCDVVHISTEWVSSLTLDCNGAKERHHVIASEGLKSMSCLYLEISNTRYCFNNFITEKHLYNNGRPMKLTMLHPGSTVRSANMADTRASRFFLRRRFHFLTRRKSFAVTVPQWPSVVMRVPKRRSALNYSIVLCPITMRRRHNSVEQ